MMGIACQIQSTSFEMRRLEALSNTIFGVAMTLLAYNFPKAKILNGSPVWSTLWAAYHSQLFALLISFVVAGMFWNSHQRRLAFQPHATRPFLYLNLLFLLSIILLPVTTGLYGTYGNARDIVVLYSCHLAALAGVNGMLWLLAGLPRGQPGIGGRDGVHDHSLRSGDHIRIDRPTNVHRSMVVELRLCDANCRGIFRKA